MNSFDFVKWLQENSNCEDPDSQLLFAPADFHGGVCISDYEGYVSACGATLEEACLNFTKAVEDKYGSLA